MHYNNIFLVKATSKTHAIKLTKAFLEPFNENIEVKPYKEYINNQNIKDMLDHYKRMTKEGEVFDFDINKVSPEMLENWDGDKAEKDDRGWFYWRTYNPMSEWDWYQFGGRWMWSNLAMKYEEKLYRPQTNEEKRSGWRTYWNKFHDKEVIGKLWECEFPDGSKEMLEYGNPYPLQRWVHDNPEYSEVKDATDMKFFEIIKNQLKTRERSIKLLINLLEKEKSKKDKSHGMEDYYKRNIENIKQCWTNDSYFWNITDNCLEFDKEKIMKNPKWWFLVNVDLHI